MNLLNEVLAASENYVVAHQFETAYLIYRNKPLCDIGDFYGDPNVAIIDKDEKWCAIGGCGLIIYFLRKPFLNYDYHQITSQYFELGRYPPNIWWIDKIEQLGPFEITITLETGKQHLINIQDHMT